MKALFLILFVSSQLALAAPEPENCKLVVRTSFASGKKKLEVIETYAASREDCKQQAKMREVAAEGDVEIERVRTSFGYREILGN